ncbi:C-type lectin domain family 4 member E isoform X1 [Salmo salar]|uniref:C-type lectin domain family 4 member E isoform X1 n=1 Tax=Salmo salar TaxID=8030 RepID=A0A1S3PY19_SALSA|nr:C-type lectin domain family 4 member E-like isoform X1 [Salmo salar]|eukprot:XP_014032600.1 PREDICTED: C-type lectin domain family 4 member E-like isoform X1 [Salmo salar]
MSEGIVYADVKFKKQQRTEGKDATASTANDTTHSEISISRTRRNQPSINPNAGDPDSQEGSKVKPSGCDPVRVVLVTLCVLLMGAVIGLGVLFLKHNQELIEQRTCCTITEDKRPICAHDWMCQGKNCYYFSNDTLTWVESRDKCVSMGGQLVIIDSQDEQKFLDKKVGAIMSNGEDKFWIGLTDQKEEGKWLWVDDTPLDSKHSFWFVAKNGKKEPDDWQGDNKGGKNPDGEDCARMGEKAGTHNGKSWFDVNCGWSHRRICEKMLF